MAGRAGAAAMALIRIAVHARHVVVEDEAVEQEPLEDAGLLGVDKGAGVGLMMLAPGLSGPAAEGHEAPQPKTRGSDALFHINRDRRRRRAMDQMTVHAA